MFSFSYSLWKPFRAKVTKNLVLFRGNNLLSRDDNLLLLSKVYYTLVLSQDCYLKLSLKEFVIFISTLEISIC